MMQLSYWAKDHKAASRVLIGALHILLFTGTVYTAIQLDASNIHLHFAVALIAVVPATAAMLLYPRRPDKKCFKRNYFKRKGCELVCFWAIILCNFFLFNKDNRVISYNTYQSLNGSFVTPDKEAKETLRTANSALRKSVKKQLKTLLKQLRRDKPLSGGKIALIILVVVVGLFLTLILSALACSISCNGNGTLGTVVFFGGLAGIIFLMVFAIQRISGNRRREQTEDRR